MSFKGQRIKLWVLPLMSLMGDTFEYWNIFPSASIRYFEKNINSDFHDFVGLLNPVTNLRLWRYFYYSFVWYWLTISWTHHAHSYLHAFVYAISYAGNFLTSLCFQMKRPCPLAHHLNINETWWQFSSYLFLYAPFSLCIYFYDSVSIISVVNIKN